MSQVSICLHDDVVLRMARALRTAVKLVLFRDTPTTMAAYLPVAGHGLGGFWPGRNGVHCVLLGTWFGVMALDVWKASVVPSKSNIVARLSKGIHHVPGFESLKC